MVCWFPGATLTKNHRLGGGSHGSLFSRSSGAKWGIGCHRPGALCSCEGGAFRPLRLGVAAQSRRSPAPSLLPRCTSASASPSLSVAVSCPLAGHAGLRVRPTAVRHSPATAGPPVPSTATLQGSRKDVNLGRTRSTQHTRKSLRDNGFVHREEI